MKVYLNGTFVEENEANISPFDRGFLYGDGLFETIRCYKGIPFLLEKHIVRLNRGLKALNIPCKLTHEEFREIIKNLIKINNLESIDAYLRITVTRGVTGSFKDFNSEAPTIFIFLRPIDNNFYSDIREKGYKVRFVNFYRNFLPELKHINYLPSLYPLMKNIGYDEIIFLDERKNILEGASSNIFFMKGKELITPKNKILKGIFRDFVIQIAKKSGWEAIEREVAFKEIRTFDAAFLTNSIIEVMPIKKLGAITFDIKNTLELYNLTKESIDKFIKSKK